MEILITVEEETTFAGAKRAKFLLTAPVIINLDGEEEGAVWVGCMGYSDSALKLTLPASGGAAGPRLHVTLKGLRGGHSGMVIHQKRINAALAGMALLAEAQAIDPALVVTDFRAGTEGVTNVVPGALVMDLVPSDAAAARQIGTALSEKWDALLAAASHENPSAKFAIRRTDASGQNARGLSGNNLKTLVTSVLSLTNGVTSRDARFPDGVNTSSNLGYLYFSPDAAGENVSVRTALMARSFYDGERVALQNKNEQILRGLGRSLPGAKLSLKRDSDGAWTDDDNFVLTLLKRLAPHKKPQFANGSLETGALSRSYPGRAVVSFGPTIERPHEPQERVSLSSVQSNTVLLDRLLAEIVGSREFTLRCAEQMKLPADSAGGNFSPAF